MSQCSWASAVQAVDLLTEQLALMNSLQGKFVQQTFAADGELLGDYRGNFKLMRPGFFYWQVDSPGEQLLISDGSQLWDYDVDLEQLIHNSIEPGDDFGSPMQIISGGAVALNKHYKVGIKVGIAADNSFELVPLNTGGAFSRLDLVFKNGILSAMKIVDAFAQYTEIRFLNTELNPQLAKELFYLEPPPGVDIISNVPAYGSPKPEQSKND